MSTTIKPECAIVIRNLSWQAECPLQLLTVVFKLIGQGFNPSHYCMVGKRGGRKIARVAFPNSDDAMNAMLALDNQQFFGRKMF